MALPINSTPVYNLTVPSTGQVVEYRPFLVKEEKALLIAQQSEQPKVMMDTLKQVLNDCLKGKVDVDTLATFDLEYIFTQLRAKSVGEVVELYLKCDTCEDEKAVSLVRLDLSQLEVQRNPEHTDKIELFNGVGVKMKYPSVDLLEKIGSIDETNIDGLFEIIVQCIDFIYTNEEVYYAKEQSKADLMDFLNNLTSDQFAVLQRFFETMPKLTKDIEYKCPVCGKEHQRTLEGIGSFF